MQHPNLIPRYVGEAPPHILPYSELKKTGDYIVGSAAAAAPPPK